jgi:ATP-dependent Lhr-like helicase
VPKLSSNMFTLLAKPIRKAIADHGFSIPTEIQARAIPLILQGKNVLVIAPTATGKTESAILPVLSKFITTREGARGIKILYITPLRALNRDLLGRLEWWCERLDVTVSVRHGDTELSERGRQAQNPPDMLITTPETLQAILPGRLMKRHLREVRFVIIDEIHELAEDKRGSQLSLALERLRWITMKDFQLVGLSATIGTPEVVAKFLVGANREVEIVRIPLARETRLEIILPHPTARDVELSKRIYTHPEVAARLRQMRSLIRRHRSVLLFTNTRAVAEVLASRFKVWDVNFPVSIHHGSLAKPSRLIAEKGLKEGQLKGLVCTSSLELGLDIGRIDLVIQYMSPRQVTRLIQRVGRSGHRVGRVANGVIVALDSDDALEAIVIARRASREDLEPVHVPEQPYDVLCHQIVGLLTQRGRWTFDEFLSMFRETYAYRNLSEQDLVSVLTYMHSRYPRLLWASFEDRIILRPRRLKAIYQYYFGKLSMIPDEKQYLVIDQTKDAPVGVLDEAFVAEYSSPGTKFIVRGSAWRMSSIRGDKILVSPTSDPTGAIPSWIGEEIPVPFEVAREVGSIRGFAAENYRMSGSERKVSEKLATEYPAKPETLRRALSETFEQVDEQIPVPTDKTVLVEDWEDYVVLTAHFGTLVNRTLARIIGHILSEETGQTVGVQQDAYRIVIRTDGSSQSRKIVDIIRKLPERDLDKVIKEASVKTGLFKRRMVHVARRFGAISRWVDISRMALSQLMKSFEGSVIFEEAIKETMEKDLDIENTKRVVGEMGSGHISVVALAKTIEASPIARIGLEKIGQKTDLIPPSMMRRILLDSTKARILSEARTFVCTSCWKYVEMIRIKDVGSSTCCPECRSKQLGILTCSKEDLVKVLDKKGRAIGRSQRALLEQAEETARLYKKYGIAAAYVLAGRRIRTIDAENILHREDKVSDRLYELIMEAERSSMRRRFL